MISPFASDEEIARLGERLLDQSLPKAEWTHAAHFAAATWLVMARPDIVPERDMADIIRAYNVASGGENTETAGYHETITQASLRAVRAHATPGRTLFQAVAAVLASECGDKAWLRAYWSDAVLFTPRARREWVEPDLRPLAFDSDDRGIQRSPLP